MPGRSLKASSARPSQTPLEGRADDASCLTSNTVAHPSGTVPRIAAIARTAPATFSRKKSERRDPMARGSIRRVSDASRRARNPGFLQTYILRCSMIGPRVSTGK